MSQVGSAVVAVIVLASCSRGERPVAEREVDRRTAELLAELDRKNHPEPWPTAPRPAYSAPVRVPTDLDDRRLADMVRVPAGTFTWGDPAFARTPDHEDEFYIDRTEVTVGAYRACVETGACAPPVLSRSCTEQVSNWHLPDHELHPINCITYWDAWKYCDYRGKTLPAQPQWEKAARGTDGRIYPWGNQLLTCKDVVVRYMGDRRCPATGTQPVGARPKDTSPYGAVDMAGNVREFLRGDRRGPNLNLSPSRLEAGDTAGGGVHADELEMLASNIGWSRAAPGTGVRCSLGP